MFESVQSFVNFITSDSDWLALATFVISMIAVLLVSLVKLIISVYRNKNNVPFEKKKFELVFTLCSFAVAFGINFLFLWGHTELGLKDIAKEASGYALDTSTIFIALNASKKGIKWVWNKIKSKLADGKLTKHEVVEVIDEMAQEAKGDIVNDFIKSIANK